MLPLYDRNPARRFAPVTLVLIAANTAVFVWQLLSLKNGGEHAYARIVRDGGVIPFELVHWHPTAAIHAIPEPATLVTAMFLHGDPMHLLGNMLYLWIFGNNVENELGMLRYLGFYLAGGIAAAAMQIAADPSSHVPMIGASGAIAAVLGAYALLFPKARVKTALFFGFFVRLADVPAWFLLGVWFVLQIASSVLEPDGPGVAWWAHVGGFLFGAGIILLRGLLPR